MDAIDILGELLGRKSRQPSRGGDVLKDIFGRGSQSQGSQSQGSQSRGSQRPSQAPPKKPGDLKAEAEELEDLLNVANDRGMQRRSSRTATSTKPSTKTSHRHEDDNLPLQNERALLLIRAMINAAKADGKFDQAEQKKIIEQFDSPDRKSMDFIRKELSAPLDLPEFVRSIPIGMEQQVYTMSLIAIDLDTGTEADYLVQLGKGLRISDDVREKIHQRVGAPSVY